MQPDEIIRIGEVDRSESISAEFVTKRDGSGFGLVAIRTEKSPPQEVPPWGKLGIERRANDWKPAIEHGGFFYGAFEQGSLVGFVILGPKKKDASGEIVALFVDKDHRRLGIASKLMERAEQEAKARGMDSLFLYSNPTESSVGFYLNTGFEIVGLISKEVVRSLPGDVVMAKDLSKA